jgi:hypothetical protein
LIHDLDHQGVPKQVVYWQHATTTKSIAEQNSVDIAWTVFMGDDYQSLRDVVCPTTEELQRFRQLVVNGVMAPHIMDKDLKALQNAWWDKAFTEEFNELIDTNKCTRQYQPEGNNSN